MSSLIDITGSRFGKLVVLKREGRVCKKTTWLCQCDCGATTVATGLNLKVGNTKSCGCLNSEGVHGSARRSGRTPTYRSWQHMLTRCRGGHPHYGGRGIRVHRRWQSFDAFLADMGERPIGTSIDRIDVNGHYERRNCRWATVMEQAQNKRPYPKNRKSRARPEVRP